MSPKLVPKGSIDNKAAFIQQVAIPWANVTQDIFRHMASLSQQELNKASHDREPLY